tara:strand:+ start:85 stop:204 length:120 start_codon:yes stop_codon:yes gene_type:complete
MHLLNTLYKEVSYGKTIEKCLIKLYVKKKKVFGDYQEKG